MHILWGQNKPSTNYFQPHNSGNIQLIISERNMYCNIIILDVVHRWILTSKDSHQRFQIAFFTDIIFAVISLKELTNSCTAINIQTVLISSILNCMFCIARVVYKSLPMVGMTVDNWTSFFFSDMSIFFSNWGIRHIHRLIEAWAENVRLLTERKPSWKRGL